MAVTRSTSRSTLRRLAGASVFAAATVLTAGVAVAAPYPSGGQPPTVSNASASAGTKVEAKTATSRPSTLPFTGGDVAGLAAIGAGAVIGGTVLVRRSRRHATA
jgi:hypothetical protein